MLGTSQMHFEDELKKITKGTVLENYQFKWFDYSQAVDNILLLVPPL